MEGIDFPEKSFNLGAGNNPNTNDLPVAICKNASISPDVAFVVSKFKMSEEEFKECLDNGGEVYLCVMASKDAPTMPPVFLTTRNPFTLEYGYEPYPKGGHNG